MKSFQRFGIAIVAIAVAAVVVHACSIPVFRYALERWELTAYDLVVFHKEPLSAEAKASLRNIEKEANLVVTMIDVDEPIPKAFRSLWEKHGKDQKLPWAAVKVQGAEDGTPLAWSGPIDAESLRGLTDSPMRTKLIASLSKADTAAFILLTSGDKDADELAFKMLEKELNRLEKAITLPEQKNEGPQLRTGLPLHVRFSIHRMNRDDPAEREFLRILFSTEEDLDKVKGPIVLPIFGRGRLLCSLYGKDLTTTQIANVTRFLCGECSCQVKELNPGVDLLLRADWPRILETAGPPSDPRPDQPPANKNKKSGDK